MKKTIKLILTAFILLLVFCSLMALSLISAVDYEASLTLPPGKPSAPTADEAEDNNGYDFKADIYKGSKVVYILFLGIDRTEERDETLGIYRTDSITLARINLGTKKIKVLNIPRDTYTFVPIENKKDKINHAYTFGSLQGKGIKATIDAVNAFIGRETVDYYFAIDMEPVPQIVDAIGGVKIDVEIEMEGYGVTLHKGLQVLDGAQSLGYIRWRYAPGGDIARIKRQQKFMGVMLKQQRDAGKLMESSLIAIKYWDHVQTNFSIKQFIGFGSFLNEMPDDSVSYYTFTGYNKRLNGISYYFPEGKEDVINEFYYEEPSGT